MNIFKKHKHDECRSASLFGLRLLCPQRGQEAEHLVSESRVKAPEAEGTVKI